MKDIKQFYILGEPIETEIGIISPIKVRDYLKYSSDLSVMSMTKNYIIYQYSKMNKDGQLDELINEIMNIELFEIVMGINDIRQSYIEVFERSFGNSDYLNYINETNFMSVRKMILDLNCTNEEDASLNHEIQAAIERSKRVKNQQGDNVEFADIISSIVVFSGIDYSVVNNWSIYQLYMAYSRIAQFKNFDVSTLFATVSSEKVNIESWSKHINLFEKDDHAMSMNDFNKQYGGLFK